MTVNGSEVSIEHLRRKKGLFQSYFLFSIGGLFGIHHMYLDRPLHAVLAAWTLNFMCIGWGMDLVLMPYYVKQRNRSVAEMALKAVPTWGTVCCRLPLVMLLVACGVSAVYAQGPRALHNAGMVDIERMMAKTKANPYAMLDVVVGVDPLVAKQKYEEKMAPLNMLRLCNSTCKQEKEQLTRAYEFVSKHPNPKAQRQSRSSNAAANDDFWKSWGKRRVEEWEAVGWHVFKLARRTWKHANVSFGFEDSEGSNEETQRGRSEESEL